MTTLTDDRDTHTLGATQADARRSRGHGRAIRALAASEAGRLVRHPAVVLGALLSLATTYGYGWFSYRSADLAYADQGIGAVLVPLIAGTTVAAWLTATRTRRRDVDELEAPTLLPRSSVTGAYVLAVLGPVALATAVTALWLVGLVVLWDGYGTPDAVDLVQGPVLVAMGGALGTALGTWTSLRIAPLLLLALLALPLSWAQLASPLREFAWWREPQAWLHPDLLWHPAAAHLAYLVGITGVAATLALLRHGATSRRVTASVAAAGIALAGGYLQAEGPSDVWLDEQLALALDPDQRLECETRDLVEYCVWPEHRPLIDRWHEAVGGAVRALPEHARQPLTVRLWVDLGGSGLVDAVRVLGHDVWMGHDVSPATRDDAASTPAERIVAAVNRDAHDLVDVPGYDDAIAIEPAWVRGWALHQTSFALARQAAARLLGFPTSAIRIERPVEPWNIDNWRTFGAWPGRDTGEPMPELGDTYMAVGSCNAHGQARAVIAMWAAGTAAPEARAHLLGWLDPGSPLAAPVYERIGSDGPERGWELASPTVEGNHSSVLIAGPAHIAWGRAEFEVAAQLAQRDDAEVRAALARDWQRWTDAATPTAELVAAFGLRPPSTAAERLAAAGLEWSDVVKDIDGAPALRPGGDVDPTAFGDPHAIPCA